MFKADTPLYSYEVVSESGENVMYVNYLGAAFVPSLIDSAEVMGRAIDNLKEDPNEENNLIEEEISIKEELWKNLKDILGDRTIDDENIPLSKRGLVSP